jgi:hypothetical protein
MRALGVVEAPVLLRGALQVGPPRERRAPEDHPPVLGEDGALEPLDEAVGRGMPRPRPSGLEPLPLAGEADGGAPFRPVVGEHGLRAMARAPLRRQHPLEQKARREGGLGRSHHGLGDLMGADRITRRQLPDPAHAFPVPDVTAVEPHQLPGPLRFDGGREPVGGGLGDQPQGLEGRAFQPGQALPAARALGPRVQPRVPVAQVVTPPAVEQRPADPRVGTGPGHRDSRGHPLEDRLAAQHYLRFEGHSSAPQVDLLADTPEDAADLALLVPGLQPSKCKHLLNTGQAREPAHGNLPVNATSSRDRRRFGASRSGRAGWPARAAPGFAFSVTQSHGEPGGSGG